MRTLSKIGMAGLRVGFTVSSPAIAGVLEKVRPPYNVGSLAQRAATFLVREAGAWCAARAAEVVAERAQLATRDRRAARRRRVRERGQLLLVRFARASEMWRGLADRGIVVRNFDGPPGPLAGCLRITVGTPAGKRDAARGASRARVIRLALVALLAACATQPGPGIDVDRAMADVHALVAIGPRVHDTPGAAAAAAYIERELAAMPVEQLPVGDVTLPPIDVLGAHVRDVETVHTGDPDLVVRFGPKSGRALLVMAHYDTVPTSPGAVDNAAAVAVALELARLYAVQPPAHPVMIAFTADEEGGLVGAEALAAHRGDDVEFAIALDLIGAQRRALAQRREHADRRLRAALARARGRSRRRRVARTAAASRGEPLVAAGGAR